MALGSITSKSAKDNVIRKLRTFIATVFLIAIIIPFLFIFYWMLSCSFKIQGDIISTPPVWFFKPTLANYKSVFFEQPFLRYTLNSVIVTFGSTIFALIIGVPASYSIARFKQTGIALLILIARMIPGVAYLLPWYILFKMLGLIGSYTGLIIAHITVTLPLVIWVMVGFFETLPMELEDAARIDGCSIVGTFFRITLPLSIPGVATATILSVIFCWNSFILTLILAGPESRTLPVAVYDFMSFAKIDWGGLTAAASIVTLPVLVIAFFVQRYIVSGLTAGAVKY